MIRFFTTLCLAVSLAACASLNARSIAPGADPHEGWNAVKPDRFVVQNPADVMHWRLKGFPESLEGKQKLELKIMPIPGGKLAVSLVQDGRLDDSIAALWTYAELEPTDDNKWKVVMMGEKWRCARTSSDEWVIEPCP